MKRLYDYYKKILKNINILMYGDDIQPLRPMMKFIKDNYRSDGLVGVEIGVQSGVNAQSILSFLPIKKLYLVDIYKLYSEYAEWIQDEYWMSRDMDDIYKEAKNRLSKHEDKIKFIKKMSVDAVDDIPNKLDFVYIDGNHSYEYVKEDIRLWYPKVKKGGIIGGHDLHYPGVSHAFVEFVKNKKDYFIGNSCQPEWWVIKK